MIILGIDPGFGRTGYGLVELNKGKQRLITAGCIQTTKTATDTNRLVELYEGLNKLFYQYNPDSVAIESLFFARNTKTAVGVGQARGIALLISGQHGKPVVTYAPLEVKLAVAGYGKAEKRQVQEMVKNILQLKKIPRPDDAADAVAVALTHCFSNRMRKNRGLTE